MIIPKEMIDASVNSKISAQDAKNKAMLDAIKSKIADVKRLTSYIDSLMNTLWYVREKDAAWGGQMCGAMCKEDELFGLDLCNAIRPSTGEDCGVCVHYSRRSTHFVNIYVTTKSVVFNRGDLYNEDEFIDISCVDRYLQEKDYERMLNSLSLLLEAIPAYTDRMATVLKNIINGK